MLHLILIDLYHVRNCISGSMLYVTITHVICCRIRPTDHTIFSTNAIYFTFAFLNNNNVLYELRVERP